jgi:hypothetical protein
MKKRLLFGILLLFVCMASSTRVYALEQGADGVYQIGTEQDLLDFAAVVNGGEYGANAVLTADIVLTGVWETPIGVITGEENGTVGPGAYAGTFDGQGHKITGFNAESKELGHGGLFGDANGATIKNFSIEGTLSVTAGHGAGVIAYPTNSTISNVHSVLVIDVPVEGVCHVGGVVGSSRGGNTISNCTFSGSLTVSLGSNDCFGGILGYLSSDRVLYCANYGKVDFEADNCYAGGIAGYLNNGDAVIKGCLNMGPVTYVALDGTPKYGGAIVGRLRSSVTKLIDNCWLEGSATGASKNDNSADVLTQAFCFTTAMLGTGEVCYRLNGDQTEIGWYQTMGVDEVPVLDATHKQIFMNGRLHCNGDVYDDASYSNEDTGITKDDHNFVDGFCSYCDLFDETFKTPNADGFYEINNAKQLVWFEKMVNTTGRDSINAVLTADIDLEGIEWTPIGFGGKTYTGTFDGAGFTISNFILSTTGDSSGLFGTVKGGAVIKNFTIEGTITSNNHQYVGGVAGNATGDVTISGIYSKVNIICSKSRHGGILGAQTGAGTVNIDRCVYSGSIDAQGVTGNFGGFVGLTLNNTSAKVNISNCLFLGSITNAGDNAGGFVGYTRGCYTTIKNCLSYGTIENTTNPGQFIGQLNATSHQSYAGVNYYVNEGKTQGTGSATEAGPSPVQVTVSQLAGGEVTWALNEESFLDPAWLQTLGEDEYPMPFGDGAIVYQTSTGYDCISETHPESFNSFRDDIIAKETEYIEDEELVACKVLINEYKDAIQSWEAIDNFNEFITAYKAAVELKESIKKSAANYIKYVQACEYAANYLVENNLEGKWSDFLKTYLEENVEPCNDYTNGSSSYIMEELNLDDDAIVAEIAFINQLLEYAIAGGLTSGTEVTRLLANSNFAEGFEGWTTEADGIAFASGGTDDMHILRGLGNGTFNVAQTLTEVPNGIYMMSVNAFFRSGTDIYNQFYAGQLYLNGTANYVMSPGEDVVLEKDAEPGVNCLGEGKDIQYDLNGDLGWIPNGMGGCPVAYGAGRYLNFCATEVTDSTLTVGMRSLGTGLESDWLPFGNLHIYYLGTLEEANEKLGDVLEGYAKRAQVIVDFIYGEYSDNYMLYPNISESLKSQLSEATESVGGAATGEEKMALINKFSKLFNEVHACRKAYIAMYEAAAKLYDVINALDGAGLISDDDYAEWDSEVYNAQDHFKNGDISTEEALALAEKFNSASLLPVPVSEDGVYQLATAEHLRLFSVIVNNLEPAAKAVLTADIDMSELSEDVSFEPIGSGQAYTGEFDGQGHAITNFEYEAVGDHNGLFGLIENATVKNFRISGTLTSVYNYNGVVGQAEGTSKVSGIYSDMDINVSACKAHTGGIVGGCTTASKILVEYCEYAGTLTHSGSGDCQAGILGYTYAGGVKNCIFSGTIIGESSKYGGILGYCKVPGFQGVQNCLSIGKIVANEGCTTAAAIIANWNGDKTVTVTNNYYCLQEGSTTTIAIGNKTANCEAPHEVTTEQLASGEVCFKLNDGKQGEDVVWFQTLGEDLYPVFDNTHKIVLYDEVLGYHNEGEDEDAIESLTPVFTNAKKVIYNLAGQRMSRLQKGINIIGGKKILY